MPMLIFEIQDQESKNAAMAAIRALEHNKRFTVEITEGHKRTRPQNRAMHKFFAMLSKELNAAGFDMKRVLKPEADIPWTQDSVKEYLWRPIQVALFGKESTTDLETPEVSQVYETLTRHMVEKFNVSVPFPDRGGE